MSEVKFRNFCLVNFENVLKKINQFNHNEEERLYLFRFTNKYTKEVEIFSKRWQAILEEMQVKIKEVEEDSQKEALIKQINQDFEKKLNELLDCPSELKKIDYNKIKKAEISVEDLFILEPMLINLPAED